MAEISAVHDVFQLREGGCSRTNAAAQWCATGCRVFAERHAGWYSSSDAGASSKQ